MSIAQGQVFTFDSDIPGAPPAGWLQGVTGTGTAHWAVAADATAPSPPQVLQQTGVGAFPWIVRTDVALLDGYVEVRFKAIKGAEDQAGGVVWRWQDDGNYYVARANALENNVSLYYTQAGRRNTLKYVDAPVPRDQWHRLRVDFAGTRIRVSLNGKVYIEQESTHIARPGAVGLWTKAESVTAFDDFSYGATQALGK